MIIERQQTYENDSYQCTMRTPTMKNCQALVNYARPIVSQLALQGEDKQASFAYSIPDTDQLSKVCEALCGYVVTLKAKDNEGNIIDEPLSLEDLPLDAAAFLHVVALQCYSECFQQTEIKKK